MLIRLFLNFFLVLHALFFTIITALCHTYKQTHTSLFCCPESSSLHSFPPCLYCKFSLFSTHFSLSDACFYAPSHRFLCCYQHNNRLDQWLHESACKQGCFPVSELYVPPLTSKRVDLVRFYTGGREVKPFCLHLTDTFEVNYGDMFHSLTSILW